MPFASNETANSSIETIISTYMNNYFNQENLFEIKYSQDMQKQHISAAHMLLSVLTSCEHKMREFCSDWLLREVALESPGRDAVLAVLVSGAEDLNQFTSRRTDLKK